MLFCLHTVDGKVHEHHYAISIQLELSPLPDQRLSYLRIIEQHILA